MNTLMGIKGRDFVLLGGDSAFFRSIVIMDAVSADRWSEVSADANLDRQESSCVPGCTVCKIRFGTRCRLSTVRGAEDDMNGCWLSIARGTLTAIKTLTQVKNNVFLPSVCDDTCW